MKEELFVEQMTNFQISLKKIQYLSPRLNQGLLLIYVLDGELTVEVESRFFELKEQDLLLVNRNQFLQIKGNASNCVILLTISDAFIEDYYSEYRMSRFECYSQEIEAGRKIILDKIRKYLISLIISNYRKDESYQIEMQGTICEILLILIRRFKQKGSPIEQMDTNDLRLTKIIEYIDRNYQQAISLEDMAKRSFLSSGYLSRYFKQKMGMGFSRYLMNIRLTHSMKDLMYTNDTISQISLKNGFPNTKSFNRLFKEVYGVTPHAYRDEHPVKQISTIQNYEIEDVESIIRSPKILNLLGSAMANLDQTNRDSESRFEELILDTSKSIGSEIPRSKHVLIVGELKELLKDDVRSQILLAKEEICLNFIGISHLLSGETIAPNIETDERIATSSPYYKADIALNFTKKNDLSLFIKIDYQEISSNEEDYFIKLNDFIKHSIQLYGSAYLSTWHILFYESYYTAVEAKELKRVYLKMYHLLKSLVPEIHVGAFFPFSYKEGETNNPHTWILTEADHIDFIGYQLNQNEIIDFQELSNERFFLAKDFLKEQTTKFKSYLKKQNIEKPLHLITWNTLSGNTRFTNGTFFRAALVLKSVLDISNDVQSIGFWINSAIHEGVSKSQEIRIEGLELFHYFNGKRPAYFAMMFANKLFGRIIAQDTDYILTENESGYQLILMNCITMNPYFSIEEAFLQKLNKDMLVKIKGLAKGEYQIRKHTFDREHGALYTKWGNLNSKYGLDSEIIDYINRSSYPDLEIVDKTIDGEWSFSTYLTVNAIHFFDIRKAII